MGDDYYDYIAQGINYQRWFQLKDSKNSATTTYQQRKDSTVTIQTTNLITYRDALFKTSNLSQIVPDLISVGVRQIGKHQVMVRRGLG